VFVPFLSSTGTVSSQKLFAWTLRE
jgi:hypothetical protein